MTEEEAKTKWCPMVRAGNDAGCNRKDATDKCIGTDCMMWIEERKSAGVTYGGYCGMVSK